jgi:hypothetical protein
MPIPSNKFGYVPEELRTRVVQRQVEAITAAAATLPTVAGSALIGSGRGKRTFLSATLRDVVGHIPGGVQGIGDCVAFAYAKALMVAMAVDIAMRGDSEKWPGQEIATEWLYGAGRRVGGWRLGNRDGSIGAWQKQSIWKDGFLLRRVYQGHDLRTYDPRRARRWGFRELPWDDLATTADDHHTVEEPALALSYEQARDAIKNGNPVVVCSSQGFEDRRNGDGYARPSGTWHHAMVFTDQDDTDRPGLLCDNRSWGEDWISGPLRTYRDSNYVQPEGTFWVEPEYADRMLKRNDSYAVPGVRGWLADLVQWSMV